MGRGSEDIAERGKNTRFTGETAAGRYPAEVIRYLVNTAEAAERYIGV